MIAKIWNFSGWIDLLEPQEIDKNISYLLQKAGFTVLNKQEHFLKPQGYTALWLLAESHAAVHSFPEHGKSYLEISSCNYEKLKDFKVLLTTISAVNNYKNFTSEPIN